MMAGDPVPGCKVSTSTSIKVSQNYKFVRVRSGLDESVEVFIEFLLGFRLCESLLVRMH